ncbi:cytochrome P450 89A2-like [Chenopodium quinoa]|uniref:Cytochrome P450 n=1 Tax=Chenopodium quinoa TaxID=63459 RepID=A0A803KWU6_CHEQI|nr:cytochrome P450 89A2-like [Chenopodium quinoa]XP_021713763.1 cytochrome P450 89A2-like [Chenopodium quinoa]XP_021713764.1 cytochrome P450 89A2-like [Chenopodium quinoa]
METWFLIIVTACIAALLKALVSLVVSKSKPNIPPGPRGFPIISRIQWLGKSSTDMEAALRRLCSKFGPIVSLPIGRYPVIFISSRTLAHQALVHDGAVFADRPKPLPTSEIITSNQHNVSSASYGPNWRLFRRNLTAQILHPSKAKEFGHARSWTLEILLNSLRASSGQDHADAVNVMDHFRFAMFCLLVFMCFGDKLDESQIKEIEEIQYRLLTSFNRFAVLNLWPSVTRILLRSRWNELINMRNKQEEILFPKIRARKRLLEEAKIPDDQSKRLVTCYVDSLLKLEVPEGDSKRKLTEEQLVSFCSEFLNAGTDTTSTALQWIMANLVKYPKIQTKLFEEIKGVVGEEAAEIGEDELSKMPYLKAIVLEGLRRHPPGHFVLPHTVTQDAELGGYTVPKNAVINFMVADINLDPEVWEDPMQFKPERFLTAEGSCEEFDITGSREIKMMPFGAGRRICPGLGLAMLHLEYYVANLVWNFEWNAVDGDEVDLSEKQEFTTVMKHPLQVHLSPRKK